jgi:hypothetical protein
MKRDLDVYIEKDGRYFCFKNENNEDPKMFLEKCWFIVRNQNVDNIHTIADIWIHKKYLGLQYPDHIEASLQNVA